jgi:hypothetical protein
MRTATALLAAALLATLLGCATEGDKQFRHDAWEKSKDTTDQVAGETTDTMKKSNDKAQGFFHNLWD